MVIQSGNDDYLDDTEENYNYSLQDEDTVTPMDQNDYDLEVFGGRYILLITAVSSLVLF